jgi:hypothetical protein
MRQSFESTQSVASNTLATAQINLATGLASLAAPGIDRSNAGLDRGDKDPGQQAGGGATGAPMSWSTRKWISALLLRR